MTPEHEQSRDSPDTTQDSLLAGTATLIAPIGLASAAAEDDAPARPGVVFSMTNNAVANSITAFERSPNGTLTSRESVPTEGMGTGSAEDSANGLILANVNGETSPTNTKGAPKFLLAVHGGATRSPSCAMIRRGSRSSTPRTRKAPA